MFDDLLAGIAAVEDDPPRALLIRAEGRAVSGGVDVHEFEGLTPERASGLWDELIGAGRAGRSGCRCRSSSPPTR